MKFMEKLLVGEKVEWKKLGEVANCFSGGTPKTSNSSFYDGEIPWIRSGEINFNVIKKSERNITKEGLEKSSAKMIKKNSVVLAMTGATVGRTAVVEIETSSNQSVAAIETNNRIINYKYLFYFLAKEYNNLKKLGQGALTSLNLSIIKNIKIPVPSIETQEKIVKIFDSYTEYVTELQEKLKKELQARNKQYNYYRDMLLSEDYLNKISNKIFMQLDNVIHKTKLIEIAKLSRGKRLVRSELHENGQYPVFQNSLTPLGYYNNKNFDGGKTCIVTAGAAGEIFYQDRDFWAADDVLVITTDDILNKYLYYFLLNKQNLIKSKVRKASVPRLSRDDIEKIEVSLPLEKLSVLNYSYTSVKGENINIYPLYYKDAHINTIEEISDDSLDFASKQIEIKKEYIPTNTGTGVETFKDNYTIELFANAINKFDIRNLIINRNDNTPLSALIPSGSELAKQGVKFEYPYLIWEYPPKNTKTKVLTINLDGKTKDYILSVKSLSTSSIDATDEGEGGIYIYLDLPFEDLYTNKKLNLDVLPKIETLNYIESKKIYVDTTINAETIKSIFPYIITEDQLDTLNWQALEYISFPVKIDDEVVGIYTIFNERIPYIRIKLKRNVSSPDESRYLNLKYPTDNIHFIRNSFLRLRNVYFENNLRDN